MDNSLTYEHLTHPQMKPELRKVGFEDFWLKEGAYSEVRMSDNWIACRKILDNKYSNLTPVHGSIQYKYLSVS